MRRFIQRHQPPASSRTILIAGVGAALAIAALALLSDYSSLALLMAPFGASCVLLFAAPAAPLSQPVNVVAGHCLAGAIGLAVFYLVPSGIAAAALAVGIAVAAMTALRIVHPPAGATALVAGTAKGLGFLLFPVLAGSIGLVVIAALYHRFAGTTYPLPASRKD